MIPIDLDNIHLYGRADRKDMAQLLWNVPQDCLRGWHAAHDFALPKETSGAKRVLILGMGGSAIAGDFIQPLAQAPVQLCRELALPPGVDGDTLVIASSFSGNTEETLSSFGQAMETPAKKMAVAGGGELAEVCQAQGIPLLTINHPGPPRCTLAFASTALAGIMARLGLLRLTKSEVEETARLLETMVKELDVTSPVAKNPAKALAGKLYGKIPIIYGGDHLAPVARRWKCEFNENAKQWSFYEIVPEAGHNAVVGYVYPRGMNMNVVGVMLHSAEMHPRVDVRMHATQEIMERYGVPYEKVEARGTGRLAQMLSLTLLGDYTSYYLAILNQIDPTPVEIIDWLKKRLTEG